MHPVNPVQLVEKKMKKLHTEALQFSTIILAMNQFKAILMKKFNAMSTMERTKRETRKKLTIFCYTILLKFANLRSTLSYMLIIGGVQFRGPCSKLQSIVSGWSWCDDG
jgi:hypothetical protein